MSSAAPDVAPALTISVTEASSSVPAPPDVAASPRVDARDAVSSPLSPRGILKTATSRALKRASVHATMASVLISNSSSRIVFKILVLGGPGVGKSSLLRAAALGPTGDQLTAGEQARYTPSLAPHFTTLHAAWLRDRPVFAQLWEVPFSLLVADAAARAADSVSASDGRRFPGSRSLDIAFADAHAAVVLFDARDAGPPLGVKYSVFDASGAAVEAEWRGNSLAAADLARDVLAVRVCAPLAAKGLALPLYLLAHKGDHPAALSTALQHQRQQRSASLSTMAAAAAEDASAGGGGGDTREANAPRLSGVFEDFFGRSAAASVVDAPSDLSARAGGAVGEGGGAEAWGATSASIPVSGFGVPYLRFSHGGTLSPADVSAYCAAAGYRGWAWSSTLASLTDAPPSAAELLREARPRLEPYENASSGAQSSLLTRLLELSAPLFGPAAKAAGGGSGGVGEGSSLSGGGAGPPPTVGSASATSRHGAVGISENALSSVLATLAGKPAGGRRLRLPPPCASVLALLTSIVDDCLECHQVLDK